MRTLTWQNRDASCGGVCPSCNEIIRKRTKPLGVQPAPVADADGNMNAEVYECPFCHEAAWFHCLDRHIEMIEEEAAEGAKEKDNVT